MKFVILFFTILVNFKLIFCRLFAINSSISGKNSPFTMPSFLEKKSFSKKSHKTKKTRTYKMKITIIKDIDTENDSPLVIKGNVKMDKKFEIYGKEDILENSISFLK